LRRQLLRFTAVGLTCTAAYLVLFTLLQDVMSPQLANAFAMAVTTIANTAANRRVTFGVTGRRDAARHQAQALVVFAFGLALTSGALDVLDDAVAAPSRITELTVVVLANLAATVLRFVLLRLWIFRSALRPELTDHVDQ
jgi:putative flippase GtrA